MSPLLKRRIAITAAAALMLAVVSGHGQLNVRVLTHDVGDHAPARVQAAIDLGLVAVSVLVTWTRRLAR